MYQEQQWLKQENCNTQVNILKIEVIHLFTLHWNDFIKTSKIKIIVYEIGD